MLEAGATRERELPFIAADNLALPFADNSFHVLTISFGLRNVADTKRALEEAYRVCAPGGRLVICEFSHPTNRLFRAIYFRYLMRVLPPLARAFSSNPDAYTYLAESIEAWPNQRALAELISQAGWGSAAWQNLTGGIVAIHSAHKPN
jgi:demethylmenaquinone methyltransferase/2-methoxy-6-polyprenyl-1,4-benzoquinol methylase